ncbi:MAG: AI-2E family transporter [Deltaproteobacteria bacterium]|nr:MAG: AI-2E family transporter [Deltaproteobacteria bacterium]
MDKKLIAKIFLLVLVLALILLLRLFWTYVSAIVLALLIASAFYPLYSWIKKLVKGRERSASLIVTILIFLILVVPVGSFVGTLSNEALDFYSRTRSSVSLQKIKQAFQGNTVWAERMKKAQEMFGVKLNPEAIEQFAASIGKKVGLYLSGQLRAIASNLLSFLIHFFLMMLTIYYILLDGVRLKNYISELLPFPPGQQNLVVNKFREMARAIIVGNGINGIIQGILGGFGFYFFGLGSPFLWGTVIGFMAFLPVIGSSVVFVPATIILALEGKFGLAASYFIYNLCYSSIMEYVVKPRLIGKGMRMNPLLVFFGILGGMKLFGILGIIYGPLIITIFLTLAEIYRLEYKETLA